MSCLILNSNTVVAVDISGTLSKFEWKYGCINKLNVVKTHHEKDITNAFFDGDMIAVRSEDPTVSLWCASSLTHVRSFHGHNGSVSCTTFNSLFLVSGSSDSTIRVYNMNDSKLLTVIKAHKANIKAVQF